MMQKNYKPGTEVTPESESEADPKPQPDPVRALEPELAPEGPLARQEWRGRRLQSLCCLLCFQFIEKFILFRYISDLVFFGVVYCTTINVYVFFFTLYRCVVFVILRPQSVLFNA